MKQRFYLMIECEKELDPKEILFALREARPNWGNMSASLAAQQNAHLTGGESAAKVGFLTPEEDAAIKADNQPAHPQVA